MGNHFAIAIIFPIELGAVGYFIVKKTTEGLADEVFDAGDSLVVRFGHEQEEIPLSNIMNVAYAPRVDPSSVTLALRVPCRFGPEISFYEKQAFLSFGQNPVVTNLVQRIDVARQAARWVDRTADEASMSCVLPSLASKNADAIHHIPP